MKTSLAEYRKKRRFKKTKEPVGKTVKKREGKSFVIQKHYASRLHFDFRLEVQGTLKSWAVPKGPSLSPKERRLAVMTEDHPVEYKNFEGVIPSGEYGAGVVMIWDKGKYKNIKKDKTGKIIPMKKCISMGSIEVWLEGEKLKGGFALVNFRDNNWLLIKMKDEMANMKKNPVKTQNKSAKSGLTMREIKKLHESKDS